MKADSVHGDALDDRQMPSAWSLSGTAVKTQFITYFYVDSKVSVQLDGQLRSSGAGQQLGELANPDEF